MKAARHGSAHVGAPRGRVRTIVRRVGMRVVPVGLCVIAAAAVCVALVPPGADTLAVSVSPDDPEDDPLPTVTSSDTPVDGTGIRRAAGFADDGAAATTATPGAQQGTVSPSGSDSASVADASVTTTAAPSATATTSARSTTRPAAAPTTPGATTTPGGGAGSSSKPPPAPPPAASGGWPDANSTGVPAGATLQTRGSMTVSTRGAVVENLVINGTLTIRADDVQVRNVKVVGGWIDVGDSNSGIVISDTEIDGAGNRQVQGNGQGIGYSGYTCIRCDIHGVGRGINAVDDVTLRDSWIHDLVPAGDSHNEAVLSNGGNGITIVNNRLQAGTEWNFSASIALYGDFAPIENVLVQRNLMTGGGYCIYAGSLKNKPFPLASNARFLDNRFGRDEARTCGTYGPAAAYFQGNGNQWSGNQWVDTGAEVPAPGVF